MQQKKLTKAKVQFWLLVSLVAGLALTLWAFGPRTVAERGAVFPGAFPRVSHLLTEEVAQREGTIPELLRKHPDPRVSQDLLGAWERGEVWVVSRDLPPMQGSVRLEQLTAQAVFAQYGKRAAASRQSIFIIDAERLKESRSDEAAATELEEMLLMAYEHSRRHVELPDTAAK